MKKQESKTYQEVMNHLNSIFNSSKKSAFQKYIILIDYKDRLNGRIESAQQNMLSAAARGNMDEVSRSAEEAFGCQAAMDDFYTGADASIEDLREEAMDC